MVLFLKKETCCICGNKEGKKKIANGFICKECLHLCSIPFQIKVNKNTSKELILNEIDNNKNNKNLLANFNPTKKIGKYIEFDEEKKLWLIPDGLMGKKINCKVYKFDDIIDFELLQDGENVSTTKGGLGRAVVGGALLGGVGAIVGGVTGKRKTKVKGIINSLKIKIIINDSNAPDVYIKLINSKIKANSLIYRTEYSSAQEIISMLSIITKNNKCEIQKETKTTFVADELIKLKGLLDNGILTQDEFIKEKNKILNV